VSNLTQYNLFLCDDRKKRMLFGVTFSFKYSHRFSHNHNNQVSQVTTAKSLGVTLDNILDWSTHIDKLTKKVASGIGAIKRIRHLVPQATLHLINYIKLWFSHILTIVILFGELRDNFAEQDTRTTKQGSPCFVLLKLWRWCWSLVWAPGMEQPVASQQHIQRSTMVYKALHGLAPD